MRSLALGFLLSGAVAPAGLLAQGGGLVVQLAVLVVDQESRPIEGAQGIVNQLVATTGPDGMLYFPGLAPGRYQLVTRGVGYRVDVRQVEISAEATARVIVKLTRLPLRLPPVIVTADRPGLYGIVGTTRLEPLAGAEVRLLGRRGRTVRTDSAGRFAVPAAAGPYLLRVWARGYEQRRIGVTVPEQGGQEVLIQLGEDPSFEGPSNQQRFQEREQTYMITWSNRRDVLTRSDLAQYGSRSICDVPVIRMAIRQATRDPMDRSCFIRANEVEMVAWGRNSCFLPTMSIPAPRRLQTVSGVPGPMRGTRGELGQMRRCRPYISIITG